MRTLAERYWPGAAALLLLVVAMAMPHSGDGALGTAAVLVLAFCAVFGVWFQQRRLARAESELEDQRAHAARLEALVGAMPDAWCGWSTAGTQTQSPNFCSLLGIERCSGLDEVETALAPSDAAALHGAFRRLRQTAQGFQILVSTAEGERVLQITGTRGEVRGPAEERFDLLWIRDLSAVAGEIKRQSKGRALAEGLAAELRMALDVVPCPVWLRRPDLTLAWCNRAYAKAVELPQAAVMEEQRELGAAEGRALAEQARESGIAQSRTQHVVMSGARHLIEITEAPLPMPDTAPPLVVGYALDLTRVEQLGNELERHQSAHAEVLEHLGSGIAIFGSDTRLRFHNQAYQRLWGFEESWIEAGPTYGEIMEDLRARRRLPEYADFRAYKRDQLALFTTLMSATEDLMHLPDGTTLRVLVVPHPLGGLMFVMEDVTNALALESSYNTLMAVQQETLDNLAEGIAVFGGDGRLKLSNPAYARIWKLPAETLRGEPHVVELVERMRPFFDYGADWDSFKEDLVGATLDRAARSGRIARADGTIIAFSNVPLPDGAVLNSFLDVTDSGRVEHMLRERNAALEAADRLKSEFIANVSYQLRTPLNAIMGFAEILSNQYFGELNERQMEYCLAVLDSGNRLLLLINDILDLATVEAGFLVLERQPVDVRALLEGVAGLTRDWARKQQLELAIEGDPDPGSFEADEKRLKQALFNLVSNAIKFTPAGGRIALGAERRPDAMVLWVRDSGIGIPPSDQDRVFERFERANPQARQPGAGLGLSLVRSFIGLHGGTVELDSDVDAGTTVRCVLPLRFTLPPMPEAGES
ncbi:sensor histidine kinase [Arenibaculum pallidiluteum]|uniref:sensor histidine kinase n=1 Tax=Arenibaculum pallidiluteum TaxID=2812559 RepID=UPI002E29C9E5|nr:PAS-domain containing protein [Arenibaculum pallidiluteum]